MFRNVRVGYVREICQTREKIYLSILQIHVHLKIHATYMCIIVILTFDIWSQIMCAVKFTDKLRNVFKGERRGDITFSHCL